ncbi:histidine kinase [Chitinophaga sp. MD30]|nr:histidine kinase [Chitinophaga sp. MD30]
MIVFTLQPYAEWKKAFEVPVYQIIIDVFVNLIFSIFFLELIFFIDKVLNRIIPWTTHPLIRLLIQSIIQIVGVLIIIIVLGIIYLYTLGNPKMKLSESKITQSWYLVIATVLLVLMMGALNTVHYLVTNWKRAAMQAAEYKIKAAESRQLAAETELQALKLQVDPHFVFNNLSVLSELILKDPLLGHAYTENFAKVYKYLLVNSKNKLITLREELKFLHAYLFLIKNRIGEGAVFNINIANAKLSLQIPPATLQLFVENALKYNSTEKGNPLTVEIYSTEDDELVVSNVLLPLLQPTPSTGIGLQNILGRYALLSDRKPVVEVTKETFTVTVPLIK